MVDNLSESRVRWSFLDDKRNKFDVDSEWWLYKQMYKEQRLKKQFIDESTEGSSRQIKKRKAEAYQQQIERF
jgi:hypothetical protein